MSKGIPYKDVIAMPGSTLHKKLSENKPLEAMEAYAEMEERERNLMARIDQETKRIEKAKQQ